MNKIKPVQQKAITGIGKILIYIYMSLYIAVRYFFKVLSFKLSPLSYIIFLYRLIHILGVLFPNKTMKVDGKYRFQLYIPSFPSPAFFHAIDKYLPGTTEPGPISVVFSMTKACPYKCPHCYQRMDKGPELDIEIMKQTAREMQDIGVAMFDIEGGEPLVRFDRLLDLLSALDERAEIWINTTGHKLTVEQARKMKEAGVYGVMVSIHTANEKDYDDFTGIPGSFQAAKRAIKIFQENGIITAINYCPVASHIKGEGVEELIALSAELDCTLVQVIHAKPSGGWLYEKDEIYGSKELMTKLNGLHKKYNESSIAKNYPSILFQVFEEDVDSFGCTAGGIDRFYLNHEGEVQPCEFVNVSFGNVKDEPFLEIYKRMRSFFKQPGTNWLCCTEAHTIGDCLKANNLEKTPLTKEYTEQIVKKWDKGEITPVYKRMGIYKK